jgi:hypothetical protein
MIRLEFIKKCVVDRRVLRTYHINMRLRGRFISRRAIVDSLSEYEIIEEYPEDKYLPSYLLRSEHQGDVFHILCAADVKGGNVRIVTAYRPDPERWDATLRKRKHS